MTARRRILGAAAGAVGLAAAGAVLGINHQSRAIRRRKGDTTPLGSLRSRSVTIVADDGVTASEWSRERLRAAERGTFQIETHLRRPDGHAAVAIVSATRSRASSRTASAASIAATPPPAITTPTGASCAPRAAVLTVEP